MDATSPSSAWPAMPREGKRTLWSWGPCGSVWSLHRAAQSSASATICKPGHGRGHRNSLHQQVTGRTSPRAVLSQPLLLVLPVLRVALADSYCLVCFALLGNRPGEMGPTGSPFHPQDV